ncbi:MAG: hypothetical protein R3C46_01490 [Hyphomonadaceae bacterium]
MRVLVSILLGIIAIAAAGVWALGQFGGGSAFVSEPREPLVREAEIAAVEQPATPTPASPDAARKVTPDEPAAPEQPQMDEPAKPDANPFSTFSSGGPGQPEPQTPSSGETPAAPVEDDIRVAPQSAPVTAPAETNAVPASLEAQYKSRRLTYNRPPAKLALDKAIDISLIIDTSRETDAADRLQGLPGEIVTRDVDLSDTVSAELLGAAFDIQLQTTSTRQKLSPKLANEWRWRVTPKQKGTHTLTLNVYGYAVGSLDAEPLDSYRDEITVEVEPVDEIVTWARGVQPLFAVLAALAGVGSAIFAFLRFREEKKQTSALTKKDG